MKLLKLIACAAAIWYVMWAIVALFSVFVTYTGDYIYFYQWNDAGRFFFAVSYVWVAVVSGICYWSFIDNE